MNHNPWTVPALFIGACAAIAIVITTVYYIVTERGDVPRHRHSPRHSHRAVPFADPADDSDPDGTGYVGQLLEARALADADHEDDAGDWWDQAPPSDSWRGPRWHPTPEPAAAPGAPDDAGEPCPDCQHWVCGCDPHVDTTGVQPHAVLLWGMTSAEKVAELAAEYMP